MRNLSLAFCVLVFGAGCQVDSADSMGPASGASDLGGAGPRAESASLVDAYLLDAFMARQGVDGSFRDGTTSDLCLPVEKPDPVACAKVACSLMSSNDCDDTDEVLETLRACKGNYGGACLSTLCSHLSPNDCDDLDELAPLAAACRGPYDGSCVQTICARLSPNDCDDADEILPLAASCAAGLDLECLAFVCDQLSPNDCDDTDEVLAIASACSGL